VLLVRVLRGDHEKRLGKRVRPVVHRHLALAHRLEERALRPRVAPVDLVRENDVGEQRPRREDERPPVRIEDVNPQDILRKEVARELDPAEGPAIPEEIARASVVLPVPGTSSRRTWPPAMKEAIARSTDSRFPRRTVSTFARNEDRSPASVSLPWEPLSPDRTAL